MNSRPDSARTVDVYLTNNELEDGRKAKQTACLKVDPALLKPAACVSKQGISTGAMFTEPEPPRSGRNLTDGEMGMLYDKFVGAGSLGNTSVRMELHERGLTPRSASTGPDPRNSGLLDSGDRGAPSPSPGMAVAMAAAGSAVRAAALDEQYAEQAAATAKMKYVAPHIARKYGIKQHIRPASAAAASPYAASSVSAGAAAARGGGRAGGVATPRPGTAAASRPGTSDNDANGPGSPRGTGFGGGTAGSGSGVANAHLPYGGKPPRPQSAAFVTVSRSKAQTTGSKFLYGGKADVPNPGKYFPRYGAMDKAQPARDWSKMYGGPNGSATAAAAQARRPGSAPPGGQRSEMTMGGGGAAAEASGYPTVQASTMGAGAGGGGVGGPGAPKRSMSLSAGAAAAQQQQQQQQQQQPTAAELARAQTAARHEELFAGAHHVHERAPSPGPGTTSFKAPGRRPPETATTAGHLYGEYFHDGYDALTRRSSRPSSAFQRQVPRPPPTSLAPHGDTGPALGPGVYCAEKPLPATHTGRHVTAGHSSLSQTRDWSRTGARPGSAPHARPPPAGAYHQGYWGPDGPSAALFPDAPEYDQMVALRALQERAQQREDARHPRRTASARQPPNQATAPIQQPQYAIADADPHADGRPLAYVGPERYGQYSSTGLAKRVQGGAFSNTTRAIAAHGMRVMADGKVTPPANVAVRVANDLTYDYDAAVEGHRGRPPAWQLPPNRNALSQRWVSTAATAYLNT